VNQRKQRGIKKPIDINAYGFVLMAEKEGESSNQLFEILALWSQNLNAIF